MIDLGKASGLPVLWDPVQEQLICGEGMNPSNCQPDIRTRGQMQDVLMDNRGEGPEEFYYMYRGLSLAADESLIKQSGLRYDITAIRPGTVNREFIKTAGHYHPIKPGTNVTWPEVYEVLNGRAHYLLQSFFPDNPECLNSVYLIAARKGDKVLIPPHFGHITINPGDDFLIMSNWVADGFASVYEPIKRMQGGAYYEVKTGDAPEFLENRNYCELPPLVHCPVTPVIELSLITGLSLYSVFKANNQAFDYLKNPEEYTEIFSKYVNTLADN